MKGTVNIMKKYILAMMVLLLCIIGAGSRRAEAYSVTMQTNGIYADVIPDSFVDNTADIFKKYVEKTMKYYNKYKDADDYTYVSEVPEEYRDFIPVVKQIQDSDEIIIKNPFYIYWPMEGADGDAVGNYCFFAVLNEKKLCMFRIEIELDTGKISFWYDKIMDGFFSYDETTVGETLFYEVGDIIFAETPDQTSQVRDRSENDVGYEMIGDGGTIDWEAEREAVDNKFIKKSYREKKDEILTYLAKSKKGKAYKKVEKKAKKYLENNSKSELDDEFLEPAKAAKEGGRTGIFIVIGIMVIAVVTVGIILLKKRKKVG